MIHRRNKHFLFLFLFVVFSVFIVQTIHAQTATPTPTVAVSDEKKKSKEEEIKQLEQKVTDLRGQSKTLSNQITAIDSQIKLTQLRITATEQQIEELNTDIDIAGKKVSKLETSLTDITKVLAKRIVATYQTSTIPPVQVFLTSNSVSDFLDKANYLKIVQAHDKELVYATEQAKQDYANQKDILEGKKQKVEELKTQLVGYTEQIESEKASKNQLLRVTQNDEAKYQQLLAQARAEYAAIQGIVAGNGSEVEAGQVSPGQRIASIISGSSCNSGGTHLHFIVRRNGATENPFSYLRGIDSSNCSGSSCGSGDGDAFNPSGSWDWPIGGPITMNQGYGPTWATRNTWVGQIYSFHNGIDIMGSSLEVRAVKGGTLYQGSYGGGGGCRLRYVRVKHTDDGLDTLYLHINY
ncbi:MAG: hypothetical protein KBD46_01085 [Candidatus Levybacteria bacterium]|nr:hypothetical protein [Candidatus Levybacteria bacterium]